MKERLIFFINHFDIVDIFVYELKTEFENIGYEILLFDWADEITSAKRLIEFVKQPVKAVILFNSSGYNINLLPGKNIWDALGIFCISILLDHPCCFHDDLQQFPQQSAVLCVDEEHMHYVQRFHPQIPVTGFLPLAGVDKHPSIKAIANRNIDIFYAGSLHQKSVFPPKLDAYTDFDAQEIADELYAFLLKHPAKAKEEALAEILQQKNILLEDSRFAQLTTDLYFVDLKVMSYYRQLIIGTLVKNGVRVYVCGKDWEICDFFSNPNFIYGGVVPANQVPDIMQDSKIILNTMPWFKSGAHDRIFNGMLSGAVVVTDSSAYLNQEFPTTQNEALVMFELTEIQALPNRLQQLLADTNKLQKIADNGYTYAKEHHTWKHRAHELEDDLLSQL